MLVLFLLLVVIMVVIKSNNIVYSEPSMRYVKYFICIISFVPFKNPMIG